MQFKKIEESALKDRNIIDLNYIEDEGQDENDGL